MNLVELKHYLQRHRFATLEQLSQQFDRPPEVVRSMLERWMAKGRVRCLTGSCSQEGCEGCPIILPVPTSREIYFWTA